MPRTSWAVAFVGALLACSDGSSLEPVDAGSEDAGVSFDLGTPDATVPDAAPADSGVVGRPDAGFGDPSIIAQGRTAIGRAQLFVTVRGTLTSTMPPLVVLPTGPMHGQEYLYGPTEFLLGPGGVDDPDRLMVYLDPRATGRSSFGAIGEADVTVENHVLDVENLVAYIDDLRPGMPRIDFLGHGYGAALAMLYASRHPERVSRLVLANPFPSDIFEYALWLEQSQSRLSSSDFQRLNELTQFRICLQDIKLCSEESWRINGPTWACPENRAIIEAMDFRHLDFRAFGFYINRDLRELEYDWSPDMGRVPARIPTTILSGPCDPIPASAPLTYTASIAGSVHHVVPGSGHFTLTEQPEAFRRIVRGALTY